MKNWGDLLETHCTNT